MDIRSAPMEGITDAVWRRVHHACFGHVTKYYIPFISPTVHCCFPPREWRAIAPEQNAGVPVVPQVLAKNADHFLWAVGELQNLGYDEVNLNIGCPSGTVTAKGKGSGMLRELDHLRSFLDDVFARSPLPLSIKTRIGFASVEEWPAILELLRAYPMKELIIHPRLRSQFYKGEIYLEAFHMAVEAGLPLVYNGDLFSHGDALALQERYPDMPMMLGRGLIADPALPRQLAGGAPLTVEEVRRFHDALAQEYSRIYPPQQVHSRMREVMKHISCCFEQPEKSRKLIAKSNPANYADALERVLAGGLRADKAYFP